ncbi:MAG: ArsR family transcriptional regulator [Desulfurococcales archaeon]|nr:ArsR family transcriptional regulator [Desulfurococcales archaeon]
MKEKGDDVEITNNLSVVYEDPDVIVYTAPNEEELKEILLNLLRKHERMNIRELHSYLSGLASEDKIRYALNELMKENKVVVDRQGYYYLAEFLEEEGYYYLDDEEEYYGGE